MTMKDESGGADLFRASIGCAVIAWNALITSPMWLAMLFGILHQLGDGVPQWLWILYFAYAPCYMLGALISVAFEAARKIK